MYITLAHLAKHFNQTVDDINWAFADIKRRLNALEAKQEPHARVKDLEDAHAEQAGEVIALKGMLTQSEKRVRELEENQKLLIPRTDISVLEEQLAGAYSTIARMTPVVEAACRWSNHYGQGNVPALQNAVKAYKESANA